MADPFDLKTATFMHEAIRSGIPFKDVASNPPQYFEPLGIRLTDHQSQSIKDLADASDEVAAKPVSPEAQDYLRSVLNDGRYVIDWTRDPRAVADGIGFPLSPEVEEELKNIKYVPPKFNPQANAGAAIAVISVAVAVIVAASKVSGIDETVIDTSRIDKL